MIAYLVCHPTYCQAGKVTYTTVLQVVNISAVAGQCNVITLTLISELTFVFKIYTVLKKLITVDITTIVQPDIQEVTECLTVIF